MSRQQYNPTEIERIEFLLEEYKQYKKAGYRKSNLPGVDLLRDISCCIQEDNIEAKTDLIQALSIYLSSWKAKPSIYLASWINSLEGFLSSIQFEDSHYSPKVSSKRSAWKEHTIDGWKEVRAQNRSSATRNRGSISTDMPRSDKRHVASPHDKAEDRGRSRTKGTTHRYPAHTYPEQADSFWRHKTPPVYDSSAIPSYDENHRTPRRRSSTRRPTDNPYPRTHTPHDDPRQEEAAKRYGIPSGYSLKHWDPEEKPFILLGSVFDYNSLGKWIYDWTCHVYGPGTPILEIAGKLWLLLIQVWGKCKTAEEALSHSYNDDDKEMLDAFIEDGVRLEKWFERLLKVSGEAMRSPQDGRLVENAAKAFVDTLFGRDYQLEDTERFIASCRWWDFNFDENCKKILDKIEASKQVYDEYTEPYRSQAAYR